MVLKEKTGNEVRSIIKDFDNKFGINQVKHNVYASPYVKIEVKRNNNLFDVHVESRFYTRQKLTKELNL